MQSDIILKADNISKTYSGNKVLSSIELQVRRGKAIALVGENGCGKSTLLRILSGITRASCGDISVDKKIRMSFIPDRFDRVSMTIPVYLKHICAIEGIKGPVAVCDKYLQMFALTNMLKTPMMYLSKGTLQKVAVIQALLSDRDIIFMDEPLSGQDIISQYNFVGEMNRRKAAGTSLIMVCHEKYLIDMLADEIYQIKDGRLIDGTGYVYSAKGANGLVIFETDSSKDIEKIIPEGSSVVIQGRICRVMCSTDRMTLFLEELIKHKVRIIRYEESGDLC